MFHGGGYRRWHVWNFEAFADFPGSGVSTLNNIPWTFLIICSFQGGRNEDQTFDFDKVREDVQTLYNAGKIKFKEVINLVILSNV